MAAVASIAERLAAVRGRIVSAARRAGRDPATVRLVAVSKGHPPDRIADAAAAGCVDIGENYVQELLRKAEALADLPLRWHLIGPLQRNKARHVVGRISLLHTLDSPELAAELEKRAAARSVTLDVLCQVNVAGEAQKSGVAPAGLLSLLDALRETPHLSVRGLTTIPPLADDPEASRPHFRTLRELRDDMARRDSALELPELSMGMSADLEVAIEEGATLVRVGTAIFGERAPKEHAA